MGKRCAQSSDESTYGADEQFSKGIETAQKAIQIARERGQDDLENQRNERQSPINNTHKPSKLRFQEPNR